MRPVTQTALVEVNSASMYATSTPGRMEMGSIKRALPIRITAAKPRAMSRPGGCFFKNRIIVRTGPPGRKAGRLRPPFPYELFQTSADQEFFMTTLSTVSATCSQASTHFSR